MKIAAIIPLKEHSMRVPNKNFRPFAGRTLLDIKLEMLDRVPLIDRIIINTESDAVISYVTKRYRDYLPQIDFVKRDSYYASPQCSGSEFFEEIARTAPADVLIYSPVTSPMVKPGTLQNAVEIFNCGVYDTVVSVQDMKHHMWMGDKPVNYQPYKSPNSQDLPPVYRITYGFGILKRELMQLNRNIIGMGDKVFWYDLDEIQSVDVDTELDWKFAEWLYKNES